MNLCDDGHDEVCFEGNGDCPVCQAISELDRLETSKDKAIKDLQEEIDDRNKEIDDLETTIDKMRSGTSIP